MRLRKHIVPLCALASLACSSATPSAGAPPTEQSPGSPAPAVVLVAGSFGGNYRVPVSAELAAAATFDVPEIDWAVTNGVATLSYKLPRDLVGKTIRVDFAGPFDPVTNRATLTGAAGTSDCAVTSIEVSCTETMPGLLPVNPDLTVVGQLAASYPGPAADRIAVAMQFAGDPIGIARVDLQRPVTPSPAEPEPEKQH